MNTISAVRQSLSSLLTVAFLFTPIVVQAQDAIGRVIQTAGVVTAVNVAGAERRIARGSEIFVGETVTTGPRGSTQLRLTDGAVISLEVDSFFTIDEYEYDGAGGAADTTIMTMIRGTMRTLTGTIGDAPADIYELNTPFANIGVRGTEYGVIVDNSGRVRVVVFDGTVALAPVGGGAPIDVGVGGDADAAEVAEDATVVEFADIPAEVQAELQAVVDMLTAAISDEQVNSLPSPEFAVEVQRQNEQRTQEQQQQQQLGTDDQAGLLVDAEGNAQIVRNQNDLNDARVVVVVSVTKNDAGAFDITTQTAVTPNQ